ncbi:hypothetical protein GALL_320750 [mine drainage metagenome]|uniref:Uncharacterized protein n=1 Tax=mine drainage metagenome TaxID=410659 RepID=A0A1J5QR37_9ZZZZ
MVQSVFREEELPGRLAVTSPALGQHADVAAGAEPALAGMVQQDQLDGRIVLPGQQGLGHRHAHGCGQGVQGLGTVEGEAADAALDPDQNFVGHWRSSSRAMITRMISLVPSRIWWTRRSRTIRSSG